MEVADALVSAELTYPSPPKYGAGRQISVAGPLAVVHHDDHVITVLWHRREGRSPNDRYGGLGVGHHHGQKDSSRRVNAATRCAVR
jgi:hypothetical protein